VPGNENAPVRAAAEVEIGAPPQVVWEVLTRTQESFSGLLARLLRRTLQKTLDRSLEDGLERLKREAERRSA
jgi:hypothetical protein